MVGRALKMVNSFGPERFTPVWEKVVGVIGFSLVAVLTVLVLVAILVPLYLSATGQPPAGLATGG